MAVRYMETLCAIFTNTKFRGSFCVLAQSLSCVQLFVTPWTVACQAALSMGFPKQEYWSGLPFPSPRDKNYYRLSL